jgi:hypothetical protein
VADFKEFRGVPKKIRANVSENLVIIDEIEEVANFLQSLYEPEYR